MTALCPVASRRGKTVPLVTLRSLVLPEHAGVIEDREWFFCDLPDCDVVYFTNDGRTLDKGALKVRVGLKEKRAPRLVCYCFDHTVESIREEIRRTRWSTVVASIKEKIQAGECNCEVLNPKGRCCLGDVNRVVKEAVAPAGVRHPALTQQPAAALSANDGCCQGATRGTEMEREACQLPEPSQAGQNIDSAEEE